MKLTFHCFGWWVLHWAGL